MKPNYSGWRYEHLIQTKSALEEMLWTGDDFPDVREHLIAVEREIGLRRFVLLAVWDGRIVKEYGRWQNEKECLEHAEQMGLPVGGDFTLGGRPFKTLVRRC
jgi:hypothetical protein